MFAGKKSAQIREILISESAWEEMTCLFAPSLIVILQVSFSRSAFVIPPQGRNKLIHQLSMHRKHIMFRANDYAALQTNGSIILSPKSECGHI
ncbi:hypothetical protein FWY22_23170 [Escherichia coli]|nr:hypothetical protein [Escherichia coli]